MSRYTRINKAKNPNKNIGNVGAEYYITNFYPEIPLDSNDIYVITDFGDRLDLLANQFYSDPTLYWVIASANPDEVRPDSLSVKGGIQLRIPVQLENILSNYETANGIGTEISTSPSNTSGVSQAQSGATSISTGGGGGGGY
jgi:hypothetical protein